MSCLKTISKVHTYFWASLAPARNLPCSNAACTMLPVSIKHEHGTYQHIKPVPLVVFPFSSPLVLPGPREAECKQDQTCHGSKEQGNQEGKSVPKGGWTCWLMPGIMKLLGRNVSLNEYVQKASYCSRTSGSWPFAGQHAGLVMPMVSL